MSTPGSGGYGFSFDDSLYVVIPSRGVGGRPGTYAGMARTLGLGAGVVMPGRLGHPPSSAVGDRSHVTPCYLLIPPPSGGAGEGGNGALHVRARDRAPLYTRRVTRVLTWLLSNAVAIAVAAWLLDGISFDGPTEPFGSEVQEKIVPLLVVSAILGLVSVTVEPVVKLLSLPFIILTLGLLLLVINALMLLLTAALARAFDLGFHVDGFWSALVGALIVTVVGWGVRTALPSRD